MNHESLQLIAKPHVKTRDRQRNRLAIAVAIGQRNGGTFSEAMKSRISFNLNLGAVIINGVQ
ncbi:MAG: hypothetical protein ACTFAK_08125 [Candidatus Electronema sp. VV]